MFHFAKGAAEVLLRKCKTVKVDAKREPLDEEDQVMMKLIFLKSSSKIFKYIYFYRRRSRKVNMRQKR